MNRHFTILLSAPLLVAACGGPDGLDPVGPQEALAEQESRCSLEGAAPFDGESPASLVVRIGRGSPDGECLAQPTQRRIKLWRLSRSAQGEEELVSLIWSNEPFIDTVYYDRFEMKLGAGTYLVCHTDPIAEELTGLECLEVEFGREGVVVLDVITQNEPGRGLTFLVNPDGSHAPAEVVTVPVPITSEPPRG